MEKQAKRKSKKRKALRDARNTLRKRRQSLYADIDELDREGEKKAFWPFSSEPKKKSVEDLFWERLAMSDVTKEDVAEDPEAAGLKGLAHDEEARDKEKDRKKSASAIDWDAVHRSLDILSVEPMRKFSEDSSIESSGRQFEAIKKMLPYFGGGMAAFGGLTAALAPEEAVPRADVTKPLSTKERLMHILRMTFLGGASGAGLATGAGMIMPVPPAKQASEKTAFDLSSLFSSGPSKPSFMAPKMDKPEWMNPAGSSGLGIREHLLGMLLGTPAQSVSDTRSAMGTLSGIMGFLRNIGQRFSPAPIMRGNPYAGLMWR